MWLLVSIVHELFPPFWVCLLHKSLVHAFMQPLVDNLSVFCFLEMMGQELVVHVWSIVISSNQRKLVTKFVLFQFMNANNITLEDGLELLRYPLTLVCFSIFSMSPKYFPCWFCMPNLDNCNLGFKSIFYVNFNIYWWVTKQWWDCMNKRYCASPQSNEDFFNIFFILPAKCYPLGISILTMIYTFTNLSLSLRLLLIVEIVVVYLARVNIRRMDGLSF